MATLAARTAPVVSQPVAVNNEEDLLANASPALLAGLKYEFVTSVSLDGLALMKMVKHAQSSHAVIHAPPATGAGQQTQLTSFSPACGQLLGLDSAGTLEVSNVVPLPQGALGEADSESRGQRAASKYTAALLPRLSELGADTSLVGFYVSHSSGQLLATPGFLDTLVACQISAGGIGSGRTAAAKSAVRPVAGAGGNAPRRPLPAANAASKSGRGIAIALDLAKLAQGAVDVKAYRASAGFVEAYKAGRFDTPSLLQHGVVPSTILEEIPVVVKSSALLTAFLSTLAAPSATAAAPASTSSDLSSLFSLPAGAPSPLPAAAKYADLSLPYSGGPSRPDLTEPLSALLSALDSHGSYLSTLSFQTRQLARDRARVESLPAVQRRKQENEQRARDGLPPLPPTAEELSVEREPGRLETMCALSAVEGAAGVLGEQAGLELAGAEGVRSGFSRPVKV